MNQVFVNKVMAISTGLGLLAAPQLPAGQASTGPGRYCRSDQDG